MHPQLIQELSHVISAIPFNRMLGLQLDKIEERRSIMSFAMREELIGNFMHGILHGGVISSVIDMAGGVAAMASAIQKHPDKSLEDMKAILGKSSTVNLHINYLRPGRGERFMAISHVLYSGNKLCTTRTEVMNEQDVLIASGSGTYLIG